MVEEGKIENLTASLEIELEELKDNMDAVFLLINATFICRE